MERRRGNRVQGGWSKPNPTRSQPKPFLTGQSDAAQKLEYQAQSQASKRNPPLVKIFNENKTLDEVLSETEENGKSKIRYFPQFLDALDAEQALAELKDETWVVVEGHKNGETFTMPRQMKWYGPKPYGWSGATLQSDENFPKIVREINKLICLHLNREEHFNSVLINHYRDNYDSVDWHSDDESLFGKKPIIASVSLGETRCFELRQKPILPEKTYEFSQHVEIPLVNGSLLIMEGAIQLDWQHRLRKEYHSRKPRINLTFRDCI